MNELIIFLRNTFEVLKSVEFVCDSSGYNFCPSCFELEPNHKLDCKLAETITNLEAIFGNVSAAESTRWADAPPEK